MTPRHEKFKQAILQSPCHVVTTVRRKTEYALQEQTNKQGRTVQAPVKVGLKEVTREGWEYEVTLNLEIDIKHQATASKDRTGLFADADPFIITEDTGKLIRDWCEKGIEAPAYNPDMGLADWALKVNACETVEQLTAIFNLSLTEEVKKLFTLRKEALTPKTTTP